MGREGWSRRLEAIIPHFIVVMLVVAWHAFARLRDPACYLDIQNVVHPT